MLVIIKGFLQICVQKSGSGDNARSHSHLGLVSVIVGLDEEMSL